jgi:hypothetical protein
MNGGAPDKKQPTVTPPPPRIVDAGIVVAPPIDAAPETPTIIIHFDSTPQGATIIEEDNARVLCDATPCDAEFDFEKKEIHFIAQLAGYNDQPSYFNVFMQKKRNDPVKVKLVKPAAGQRRKTTPLPGKGSAANAGSASSSSKTGGELGGFNPPPPKQ